MTNPRLKFKYVNGLGDFVAAILHCKMFGWFTYLITRKKEPCGVCSERAKAMNILVPLPLWRFFFKNFDAYLKSLEKDYNKMKDVKLQKINTSKRKWEEAEVIKPKIENFNNQYMLVSTADTPLGEYLVRVQTFKLI